jgi:hypothetical protein
MFEIHTNCGRPFFITSSLPDILEGEKEGERANVSSAASAAIPPI